MVQGSLGMALLATIMPTPASATGYFQESKISSGMKHTRLDIFEHKFLVFALVSCHSFRYHAKFFMRTKIT
jgi:hypothetical protein